MSLSYGAQGAAQALVTAAAVPYPTGITAGQALLLFAASDSTALSATASGFTELGTIQTGGGMSVRAWARAADGTETGTVTINASGGTKGVAWMTRYAASAGSISVTATAASDTDTSSTAFSLTGGSLTSVAGDMLVSCVAALAPSGSYSANASGVTIGQTGASMTTTARFAGRTGTNTIYYGHADAAISAGATGTATYSATTTGANGAGSGKLILLHEVASTNGSVTAVAPSVTATAAAPVPSGAATVAALAMAVTLGMLPPSVSGDFSVSGADPVGLTVAAVSPSVSAVRNASVAAVAASLSLSAVAPGVSAQGNASVAPGAVSVAVAAIAPAVSGVAQGSVSAVPATVTVALVAPSFNTNSSGSVQAVAATVSVAAVAPSPSGQRQPTTAPPAATITVTAPAPAVLGQRNPPSTAAPAVAVTVSGVAPALLGQQQPDVQAVPVALEVAMPAPSASSVESVVVEAQQHILTARRQHRIATAEPTDHIATAGRQRRIAA